MENSYANKGSERFSFFSSNGRYMDRKPSGTIDLEGVYSYLLHDEKARTATDTLRNGKWRSKDEKRNYKKLNFSAVTLSGTFGQRNSADIQSYSSMVCVDMDKKDESTEVRVEEAFAEVRNDPHVALLFRSPGGKGLKACVRVSYTYNTEDLQKSHKEACQQVFSYFGQKYTPERFGLSVDMQCSDIVRLCFLPSDPSAYINRDAEPMSISKKAETPKPAAVSRPRTAAASKPSGDRRRVSAIIEEIASKAEKGRVDIAPDHQKWIDMGFALCTEMGEEGRQYFHRLCSMRSDYNEQQWDEKYTELMSSNRGAVGAGTLIRYAREAGIEPSLFAMSFSKDMIERLPRLLRETARHAKDDDEATMIVMGSLCVAASCLDKVFGKYDATKCYCNLYLFVVGGASAGKGRLDLCKQLVCMTQQRLMKETRADKQREMEEKAAAERGETVKKARIFTHLLPANTSTSALMETLSNNKGVGLIFETEGDTVSENLKHDYGDYSSVMRKAFHNETISYMRKTESEYVSIDEPKLGIVVSGTPRQVLNLIPDAENGLFSRFIYINLPTRLTWDVMYDDEVEEPLDQQFRKLGEEFDRQLQLLSSRGKEVRFKWTSEQYGKANAFFADKLGEMISEQDKGFVSSVRRMGAINYRMLMVLTVLRALESGAIGEEIVSSDADLELTLQMSEILMRHTEMVYESLPKTDVEFGSKKKPNSLYNALPECFTLQLAYETGKKLGMSDRASRRYVKQGEEQGWYSRTAHGTYRKEERMPGG